MESWRTAGRPSASRRHVDHSAWTMLRGPVWPGQRAPPPSSAGRTDVASGGPRYRLSAERARWPGGRGQLERRAGARHGGGRAPCRRLRRVAAGEPRLVGRRRRRLPRRARRRHRRRRLRLVPGGPARGRRAPAGRRRRAPRAGGRLRARRRARAGCAAQGAWPVALDLSGGMLRHAAALGAATGVAVPLVQADAERLPFADGVVRPGLLGVRRGAVRGGPGSGDARGRPGAAARRPLGVRGEPPDALDVLRRPGPGRADRRPVVLRPHALRRGGRRRRRRPTSSTTARWATGSATSSPPGWCSTTWSSPSGRRAARPCGGSGRRCAARSSPARRSSSAAARDHDAGGSPAALTGPDAPPGHRACGSVRVRCVTTQGGAVTRTGGRPGVRRGATT